MDFDSEDSKTPLIHSIYLKTPKNIIQSIKDLKKFSVGDKIEIPHDLFESTLKMMSFDENLPSHIFGKIQKQSKVQVKLKNINDIEIYTRQEQLTKIILRGKFKFSQIKRICKLQKINLLKYNETNNSITLKSPIGISCVILFSSLIWNNEFQSLLEKPLQKKNEFYYGMKKLSTNKNKDKTKHKAHVLSHVPQAAFFISTAGGHSTLLAPISAGIISSVDVMRYYKGTISKNQLRKNLSEVGIQTASAMAGGTFGAFGGAIIGQILIPIPGFGGFMGSAIGGLFGGAIGGRVGKITSKKVLDKVVKDDSKKMFEIFERECIVLFAEYIMSDDEISNVLKNIRKEKKFDEFFRNMFKQKEEVKQKKFARRLIKYHILKVINEVRKDIDIGNNEINILLKEQDKIFLNGQILSDFQQKQEEINERKGKHTQKEKSIVKKTIPPPLPLHLLKKKRQIEERKIQNGKMDFFFCLGDDVEVSPIIPDGDNVLNNIIEDSKSKSKSKSKENDLVKNVMSMEVNKENKEKNLQQNESNSK